VHYFVGGATKVYGAALYRLRPQDFGEIQHADGLSPAWPLSYDDFEPWYTQAEWLLGVRRRWSFDLYLQHTSPGSAQEASWIMSFEGMLLIGC